MDIKQFKSQYESVFNFRYGAFLLISGMMGYGLKELTINHYAEWLKTCWTAYFQAKGLPEDTRKTAAINVDFDKWLFEGME